MYLTARLHIALSFFFFFFFFFIIIIIIIVVVIVVVYFAANLCNCTQMLTIGVLHRCASQYSS